MATEARGFRERLEARLRRMAKAFVDGLFDDGDYRRQKEQIEFELASLVVPEADITEDAGKLLLDLPRLWDGATLEERRRLLLTVLDAVYVDTQGEKGVVDVRLKKAFRAVLQDRSLLSTLDLRRWGLSPYLAPVD